nr:hypothetical protein [Tanacetum cinerariifolium]
RSCRRNGGDEVEVDIGKSSGVPDEGASYLVGESMKGGGGGAGDNTGEGGDSIGGSGGKGIRGGGEDQGDNGDASGEDIASSLTTSESDQASIGTGAGIEILAVIRYARCGGGVAADSSVLNGSVSSADGAWSAAVEATTTESAGAGCSSSYSSAGIEILAVIRYARCGGGVAADSSVSNGSVFSADGAWSAAVEATTTESAGAGCSSSSSSSASMVVPALAPQGQICNLEKVGPEERPLHMGPLASQVTQVARDHRLSVILCLITPRMG